MDDPYKNVEEYNPDKKGKALIVFEEMIVDMLSNKKPNPIATKLFIRVRKLNISPVFVTQSYFAQPRNTRLNSTYSVLQIVTSHQSLPTIWVSWSVKIDVDFLKWLSIINV